MSCMTARSGSSSDNKLSRYAVHQLPWRVLRPAAGLESALMLPGIALIVYACSASSVTAKHICELFVSKLGLITGSGH